MELVIKYSYFFGPGLLLTVGILFRYLGDSAKEFSLKHTFFSPELALSNLGSVLSALVAITSKTVISSESVLKFAVLAGVGMLVLAIVTSLQKRFEHECVDRPKRTFFLLGFFMNLFAGGALALTLFFTKSA
jgi:hypothetical protein